ncbi:MAG: type II toxin-antitoxin system RelE/ParE family toxin [Chloroflexia bacterium]|nr:type II toxin-antitoxin system RelE/ParE family toxin [Chloroflexia bacterium]
MENNAPFEVEILPAAQKDLKVLKPHEAQAIRAVLKLENDPMLGHVLQGSLRGVRALEFNLKGGGTYRAVDTIPGSDRVCVVFLVGPHENIYQTAERRWTALRKRL